jgi:hypothetical protein
MPWINCLPPAFDPGCPIRTASPLRLPPFESAAADKGTVYRVSINNQIESRYGMRNFSAGPWATSGDINGASYRLSEWVIITKIRRKENRWIERTIAVVYPAVVW